MSKSIVYVFGPDGAGKSTLTSQIAETLPNTALFNGSDPTTWRDLSWHKEILAKGIETDTLDPQVHMKAMRHCYRAANGLLRLGGVETVIIDSDLRAKAAVKATAWYGHKVPLDALYRQLQELTNTELDKEVEQVGLHVTVAGSSSLDRAELLMRRMGQREEASFYDPATLEQSRTLLEGCDALEGIIDLAGGKVVRAETNQAYDPAFIVGQLAAALSIKAD